MDQFRQLHIIRGMAALYVAIGHAKAILWCGGKVFIQKFHIENWHIGDYILYAMDMLSSAAVEFVIVFFVLSGFFIAYSFEKNNWSLKDFLINRIIRIYPPYLYSILVSIFSLLFIYFYNPILLSGNIVNPVVAKINNGFNELSITSFLSALFFIPQKGYFAGNFSYWSLFHEWVFYLLIPFLIGKARWALSIISIFFCFHLLGFNFSNLLLKFFFELGFYFFAGVYILSVVKSGKWVSIVPSKIISYLLVLFLAISTIALGIKNLQPYSNLAACLLTFWTIITLISYPIKGAFFKVGIFLSDISYSLYLLHLPVYYFLYSILAKHFSSNLFYSRIYWLAIPIAILFSWVSYLLVEKRTMVLIKFMKSNK